MNCCDVKDALDRYRLVSCELWNSNFLPANSAKVDLFDQIENLLYQALVESCINLDNCERCERTAITLKSGDQGNNTLLLINRKSDDNVNYWDESVSILASEAPRFIFIEFFDWDQLTIRKKELVKVRIIAAGRNNSLIGRLALLKWSDIISAAPERTTKQKTS